MKKILAVMLFFTPFLGISQQNVVNATRVFPKMDKGAEFEKAITAHAQKYHTGTVRWRVFEIMSGPDAGGFHITEGPYTWEQVGDRGNLGAEHTADWNKSIAPTLTDRYTSNYSVFQPELSTVAIGDYSDWIQITRLTPNPGYIGDLREMITKLKKTWEEAKVTVAVYAISSSGPNGFAIVTRYKQGLKERDPNFRPPFRDTFEKVNGRDSWHRDYIEPLKSAIQETTSELLKFRPDLSSK
jgi:hypothetical protein